MKQIQRRYALFLISLGCLLVSGLSACSVLTSPTATSTISITDPKTGLSPTPTALTYLVGAYVSNSTPTSTSGNITVYVVFHHGQLPQPGGQVSLFFHYYADGRAVNQLNNEAGTQTTGSDGYASFSINFGGLQSGIPIGIDVTVHFAGIPDISKPNATSFTPLTLAPATTPTDNSGG